VDDDSTFLDNDVSYADMTTFRTAFHDWRLPFHRKHNKKFVCNSYGKDTMSATVNLYKDQNYLSFDSLSLPFTLGLGDLYINPDGENYYIYDLGGTNYINTAVPSNVVRRKFNYRNVMVEVTDIEGIGGAEFYSIDLPGAVIGG
jgi:hypothetical protein